MKKVVKFGGSSLASASQFEKVGAIIREDESRKYVVPSAPGKRFSSDTKVTDLLYACYRSVGQGQVKAVYDLLITFFDLFQDLLEFFLISHAAIAGV